MLPFDTAGRSDARGTPPRTANGPKIFYVALRLAVSPFIAVGGRVLRRTNETENFFDTC